LVRWRITSGVSCFHANSIETFSEAALLQELMLEVFKLSPQEEAGLVDQADEGVSRYLRGILLGNQLSAFMLGVGSASTQVAVRS